MGTTLTTPAHSRSPLQTAARRPSRSGVRGKCPAFRPWSGSNFPRAAFRSSTIDPTKGGRNESAMRDAHLPAPEAGIPRRGVGRRSAHCRVPCHTKSLWVLSRRSGKNMAMRLRLSSIDRIAARKAFAVLALSATVLVSVEVLGTATVGAAGPATSVLVPATGSDAVGHRCHPGRLRLQCHRQSSSCSSVARTAIQPRWYAQPRRLTTDGCVAGIRRMSPTALMPSRS